MIFNKIVGIICLILNLPVALSSDHLHIDIDISDFRNEDHEAGHFHENDYLRFFLADGTVVCEGKLHGAIDSKIPCSFHKRFLASGPNDIFHAVFTKEANGQWVELQNTRDTITLDPAAYSDKGMTLKHILFGSLSAIASVSGTKYLIDFRKAKRNALPVDQIFVDEHIESYDFPPVEDILPVDVVPVEEMSPFFPPVLPKLSPFLSTIQGRATVGAVFGLAFGASAIATNRKDFNCISTSQSPKFLDPDYLDLKPEESEEVTPIETKPDLLAHIKKNAGVIALFEILFITAQGFFLLKRRGRLPLGRWGELRW